MSLEGFIGRTVLWRGDCLACYRWDPSLAETDSFEDGESGNGG